MTTQDTTLGGRIAPEDFAGLRATPVVTPAGIRLASVPLPSILVALRDVTPELRPLYARGVLTTLVIRAAQGKLREPSRLREWACAALDAGQTVLSEAERAEAGFVRGAGAAPEAPDLGVFGFAESIPNAKAPAKARKAKKPTQAERLDAMERAIAAIAAAVAK